MEGRATFAQVFLDPGPTPATLEADAAQLRDVLNAAGTRHSRRRSATACCFSSRAMRT